MVCILEPAASLRNVSVLLHVVEPFVSLLSGKVCLKLAWYIIWPFGKSVQRVNGYKSSTISNQIPFSNGLFSIFYSLKFQACHLVDMSAVKPTNCDIVPQEHKDLVGDKDCAPLLVSSPLPIKIPVPTFPPRKTRKHWVRVSECIL